MKYLPKCCDCWWDNGQYVVGHDEHSPQCHHIPSGGTGGHEDCKTPCNRIIGHGNTKTAAIEDARGELGLD